MPDLALWLTAQLAEDERIVREANTSPEMVTGIPRSYAAAPVALHIAEFANPARVLREIEAKRGIVARYEFACHEAAALDIGEEEREKRIASAAAFQSCVLLIAAVYETRPGYAEAIASAE